MDLPRMMRHAVMAVSLSLASWAALAERAEAAPGDALAAIRRGNDRFRALLSRKVPPKSVEEKKLTAQVTADMRTLFDIRDLAHRALVDHWDKLTAAQREDFVATLQQLIERSYVKQLRANLKYSVEYLGEEPDGGDVLVRTVVKSEADGRPQDTSVIYKLHFDGTSWRVYDVITDDVGMIRNYRSQFNRIVAKQGGIPALMTKIHQKLNEETD
jgi:phospholipid transport system substrate-binding protein